jgi:hypothetical protein
MFQVKKFWTNVFQCTILVVFQTVQVGITKLKIWVGQLKCMYYLFNFCQNFIPLDTASKHYGFLNKLNSVDCCSSRRLSALKDHRSATNY